MKTYSAKPADVEKKWVLIDAENLVVGRLATLIAMRLRGKHKPTFTPHVDMGDNVDRHQRRKSCAYRPQARPEKLLLAHRLSGRHQGARRPQMIEGQFPERVVEKAVERMLPRGPLGRQQLRNLKVYAGAEHPHEAQQPEALDIAALYSKNSRNS